MEIKLFYLGAMMSCAYLVWGEDKNAVLFDCGGEDLDSVMAFVETHKLNLEKVVLTHGHYDHIAGVNRILEYKSDIEVYIGEEDLEFLTEPNLSLSAMINGTSFKYEGPVKTVKEGDMIGNFKVIDTPGHTRGSKCFYNQEEGVMFSGDTMFKGSYGRFDLPTGNAGILFNSLKKICEYPGETKVYSGHTEVTTLAAEKTFLTANGLI